MRKIVTLILCAAMLLCAFSALAENEKQIVKVAVMSSESGANSRFMDIYKASIGAALRIMEEDGTLPTYYDFEFEYIDDQSTTEGAPLAANYALDSYGCHVSIGHLLTTMILVSGQYFEDAEIPLLGIVSGPASVSQGWEYLCIETGTDLTNADTLCEYLVEVQGYEKIAMVNVNTEGGQSAGDRVEETLKNKYGLELVVHDECESIEADMSAIVLKIKDAGAQAVICWGVDVSTANLLNSQIEQLYAKTPEEVLFCGGTNMAQNNNALTFTAEDLEGCVFTSGYIFDENNEMHKRFKDYVIELDPEHQEPSDVGARVFDAMYHIRTALEEMGQMDVNDSDFSKVLNQHLRTAKFTGVQGEFDFSQNDNGVGLNTMNVGVWTANYGQEKIYP